MKRRFIVLLAGLAYIMPAVAQQTLFDRYAEKQGVTYVNINGEIIKTLLPDMSNISIKEINILDIDNQQLLQSIDKDLQQCIKDEKYIDEKVYEVLDLVGLVREHADRYPHEFSGGQRQRIGIARAIVLEPDLIIADEPISALDVSIQAQVINLLNDLRNKMGLTIMFIAHNLSVVKYFSDRIGVMYYGKLVELADSDELFEHPLHPYTKSLLSAIPYPDPHHEKHRQRIEYKPLKEHDYSVNKPSLREIKPGHFINCNDEEFERYKKELGL